MKNVSIYHGNFVYAPTENGLTERKNAYLVVKDGVIVGLYDVLPTEYAPLPVTDFGKKIVIPAFSDLHVHAPQYPNRGLRTDALLSDWLNDYTFPLEAKYADLFFAERAYDAFIDDMIAHGTMRAVVFGTVHEAATSYLVERL